MQISVPNPHGPNSVLDPTLKPDENPWALSNQVEKISEGGDPTAPLGLSHFHGLPAELPALSPRVLPTSCSTQRATGLSCIPEPFPVLAVSLVYGTAPMRQQCDISDAPPPAPHTTPARLRLDGTGEGILLPPSCPSPAGVSLCEQSHEQQSFFFSSGVFRESQASAPGGSGEGGGELCAPARGKRAAPGGLLHPARRRRGSPGPRGSERGVLRLRPVRAVGRGRGSERGDEPVGAAGEGALPQPGVGCAHLPAGTVGVGQRRVGRGRAAAVQPGGGGRRGGQHEAPRGRVQRPRAGRRRVGPGGGGQRAVAVGQRGAGAALRGAGGGEGAGRGGGGRGQLGGRREQAAGRGGALGEEGRVGGEVAAFEALPAAKEAAALEHVSGVRVERPVVALAGAAGFPRHLDEAVVEGEVVADAVLPLARAVAVEGEALGDEAVDAAQREPPLGRLPDGHGDERDVAVGRLAPLRRTLAPPPPAPRPRRRRRRRLLPGRRRVRLQRRWRRGARWQPAFGGHAAVGAAPARAGTNSAARHRRRGFYAEVSGGSAPRRPALPLQRPASREARTGPGVPRRRRLGQGQGQGQGQDNRPSPGPSGPAAPTALPDSTLPGGSPVGARRDPTVLECGARSRLAPQLSPK